MSNLQRHYGIDAVPALLVLMTGVEEVVFVILAKGGRVEHGVRLIMVTVVLLCDHCSWRSHRASDIRDS